MGKEIKIDFDKIKVGLIGTPNEYESPSEEYLRKTAGLTVNVCYCKEDGQYYLADMSRAYWDCKRHNVKKVSVSVHEVETVEDVTKCVFINSFRPGAKTEKTEYQFIKNIINDLKDKNYTWDDAREVLCGWLQEGRIGKNTRDRVERYMCLADIENTRFETMFFNETVYKGYVTFVRLLSARKVDEVCDEIEAVLQSLPYEKTEENMLYHETKRFIAEIISSALKENGIIYIDNNIQDKSDSKETVNILTSYRVTKDDAYAVAAMSDKAKENRNSGANIKCGTGYIIAEGDMDNDTLKLDIPAEGKVIKNKVGIAPLQGVARRLTDYDTAYSVILVNYIVYSSDIRKFERDILSYYESKGKRLKRNNGNYTEKVLASKKDLEKFLGAYVGVDPDFEYVKIEQI